MKYLKHKAFLLILIVSFAQPVFAEELFLRGSEETFPTGHPSIVDVMLRGENINAVEGTLVFPEHVNVRDVWSGASTISLWIEAPIVKDNRVPFSGVVPGGVSSDDGVVLFQVVFEGVSVDTGAVLFEGIRVLYNDGAGTSAEVSAEPFILSVSEDAPRFSLPEDTLPPEEFTVMISRDQTVSSGDYFAAFVAQDKSSGVDYYEVQENTSGEIDESAWVRAESPYVLADQSRRSHLFVKAVDKQGNTRITAVSPEVSIPLHIYGIYVIIFLVALYVFRRYSKKRRAKNTYVG